MGSGPQAAPTGGSPASAFATFPPPYAEGKTEDQCKSRCTRFPPTLLTE
jgi:hypothetical protein